MPNKYTGYYDDWWDWEALLAQMIIGAASAYHPTGVAVDATIDGTALIDDTVVTIDEA